VEQKRRQTRSSVFCGRIGGSLCAGGRFSYPSTGVDDGHSRQDRGSETCGHGDPASPFDAEVLVAAKFAGVDEIIAWAVPPPLRRWPLEPENSAGRLDRGPGKCARDRSQTATVWPGRHRSSCAGPSELVVVADASADSAFIAQDLSAQSRARSGFDGLFDFA